MNFKTIVFCTDFSDQSDRAFDTALDLAIKSKARLEVLHILEPVVNFAFMTECGFSREINPPILPAIQKEMAARYGSKIDPSIESELIVREGHPSSEIIRYLQEINADLVVTGTAGLSGMGLVFFGSVSRRIAQKAPCNVLIVRQ